MSATLRNETWNPGLDHRVEAGSDLNAVDLVNGRCGNFRDVVVLSRALQSFRGGKDGGSALNGPGEQNLGWCQRGLPGDGEDCWIFQRSGSYSMTQGRKCQKNNSL